MRQARIAFLITNERIKSTVTIHITHYQRDVVALGETIRPMAEIDRVIESHGGWPSAFQPSAGEVVK